MTSSSDLYRIVLADLYRKQDEIRAAIGALEQFLASSPVTSPIPQTPMLKAVSQVPTSLKLGSPFVVSDAVLAALHALGGSGKNADIKVMMIKSGFRFRGDPIVSISQCLARLAATDLVEKVERGNWRLKVPFDDAKAR